MLFVHTKKEGRLVPSFFLLQLLPENYKSNENYNSAPQGIGLALPEVMPSLVIALCLTPDFLAELGAYS